MAQEEQVSTVDTQQELMRRALETHNGSRPTQGVMGSGNDPRWAEIDAANGGLKR